MADFQIDDDGRVMSAEKAPHDVLCQDHINIELPVSSSASETVSGFASHRQSLAFSFFHHTMACPNLHSPRLPLWAAS